MSLILYPYEIWFFPRPPPTFLIDVMEFPKEHYVDHTDFNASLYPGAAEVMAAPAAPGQGTLVGTLAVGDGSLVTLTAPPMAFGRIM